MDNKQQITLPSWVAQIFIGAILSVLAWFMLELNKTQKEILESVIRFEVKIKYIEQKEEMIDKNDIRISGLENESVSATADRFRKSDAIDMVRWIEGTYNDNGIKYKPYKFKIPNEN